MLAHHNSLNRKFQSHAGSIEAPGNFGEFAIILIACFNPTLVRLRPSSVFGSGRTINCFNPTLVRLRLEVESEGLGSVCLFQSHAGSIEAIHICLLFVK